MSITPTGKKYVLDFLLGDRESEDSWSAFIKELLARSLDRSKIKLSISDHKAILTSVEKLRAGPHHLSLYWLKGDEHGSARCSAEKTAWINKIQAS